jgi:hypothetical protein
MTEIGQLTDKHDHAGIDPMTDDLRQRIDSFDWSALELYHGLDQILIDHLGQTITIHDLLVHAQTKHPELYELVFNRTMDTINVLPAT